MEDFENEFFEDMPKSQQRTGHGKTLVVAIAAAVAGIAIGFAGAVSILGGTISADLLGGGSTKTPNPCSSPSPTRSKSPVYSPTIAPSTVPYVSPAGAPSTIFEPSSVAVTPESSP